MTIFDVAVCVVVTVSIVLLGILSSRGVKSTTDYFLAGRDMPWWAVSLSLYATLLTPLSFLGVTGWIIRKDSRWFVGSTIVGLLVIPLAALFWVKFWSQRPMISIFEYLEDRFHVGLRTFAAVLFLLQTLFWLGNAIGAAANAFAVATGVSADLAVLMVSGLGCAYALLGGARAVIWTDVMQTVVFVAAYCTIIAFTFTAFDWNLMQVYHLASQPVSGVTGRSPTTLFSTELSLAVESTVWAILCVRAVDALTLGTQQMVMQRLLALPSASAMRKALVGFAAFDVLFTCLSLAVAWGLIAIAVRSQSALPQSDYAVIEYAASSLPNGVLGLVMAGLLAAMLSSYDSALNSTTAVIHKDFYRRHFKKHATDAHYLLVSHWIAIAMACVFAAIALWTLHDQNTTMLQRIGQFNAVLAGPIATVFVAGTLFKRVRTRDAVCGGIVSISVSLAFGGFRPVFEPPVSGVNWMWVAGLSTFAGLGASVLSRALRGRSSGGQQDVPPPMQEGA